MKRLFALLLAIAIFFSLASAACADESISQRLLREMKEKQQEETEFYIIGDSEDTFAGLYNRMCVNLDLKENPIPEPDTELGDYGGGEYEYARIMKDDATSSEYVGYVRTSNGQDLYIIWSWMGYHKDGSIIGMDVYYQLDGKYLGNIQRDYSAGTSTSSHNSPYFVPGQPMNKD